MATSDSLGDRMKEYEDVPRARLTRRVPVMMRLDGKAFHTFTRGLPRPYHRPFHECMWWTAQYLCEKIQGAQIAYVQSDEITILVTDYEDIKTEAWYDYQVQKMSSVAASMASGAFIYALGQLMPTSFQVGKKNLPAFDCRVWNVPKEEVVNAFLWRQQDATRNAIQSLGQSMLGHTTMQGLNNARVQEMLFQVSGINFNDLPVPQRRGVCIVKEMRIEPVHPGNWREGQPWSIERSRWVVDENIPVFTQDRDYIQRLV